MPKVAPRPKPKAARVVEDVGDWRDIKLSGDGRVLAIGTLARTVSNAVTGWVLRRDVATGALLGKWRAPDGVASLALSRDGTKLATVGARRVSLWMWPSGRLLRSYTVGPSEVSPGLACDFSPDSRTLAVVTGGLLLFDVQTWKLKRTLALPEPPFVRDARFSPDGRRLLTAHYDIGTAFLMWDLRTRRSRKLSRHDGGPSLFSPDGRLVVGMTYNDTSLYDARTGRRQKVLQLADRISEQAQYPFTPVAFSPDGRFLAGRNNDNQHLEIYSVRTGRRIHTVAGASGAVFWPQPRVLLICSRDTVRRLPLKFKGSPD